MSKIEPQLVPVNAKYATTRVFKHTSTFQPRPMSTLAVDPVLLYAKLEVAKLEQDAARKSHRERKQQRALREDQDALKRASLQDTKSRLMRESLRQSLPLGAEYTADGKPCINTASLLAALGSSPPLRHGSLQKKALSRDGSRVRDHNSAGNTDNDAVEPGRRRRFKAEEGPYKLVPIKHGSQTTYEKVDLPVDTGLIEDSEAAQDDEHITRPKLSKYDRPHWAQQSQSTTQMQMLRSKLSGVTTGRSRKSEVPPMPAEASKIIRSSSAGPRQSMYTNDTLITDAVSQIKKKQRAKKLHTVSSLFKKPQGS